MSHVWRCDGPQCGNTEPLDDIPAIRNLPEGWLCVVEKAGAKRGDRLGPDFCSWQCLLNYAQEVPQ
jgi:hypothetical protein